MHLVVGPWESSTTHQGHLVPVLLPEQGQEQEMVPVLFLVLVEEDLAAAAAAAAGLAPSSSPLHKQFSGQTSVHPPSALASGGAVVAAVEVEVVVKVDGAAEPET